MSDTAQPPADDDRDLELAGLRTRIRELESELAEQSSRSAAIVARSQEKLYWLERWHVDLDTLMAKKGAVPALEALKTVRSGARSAKRFQRRLRGG